MSDDSRLRDHLLDRLAGRGAHLDFGRAMAGWAPRLRGVRPQGTPHSGWEMLEHLRIAQWDILEFSRNPRHVSPEVPEGYWPGTHQPPDERAWDRGLEAFETDLRAMQDLVADPSIDLLAPLPHGSGQTVLREALLVADHNAYHLGQMVLLRRLLHDWDEAGSTFS